MIEEVIRKNGVVPVVTDLPTDKAAAYCEVLLEAGLPVIEVTLRKPYALDSLKVAADTKGMITGAGTVYTKEQAQQVVDAGVDFVVSPGLSYDVAEICAANDVIYIPGIASPRDIQDAIGLGLKTLKFFPAEALGGVKTLKAISAPYPGINFMPTGGISMDNLKSYLELPNVLGCGGSWLASADMILNDKMNELSQIIKETLKLRRQS